jgi:hypothetical protein
MWVITISGFHSNPPQASTTPLRAPIDIAEPSCDTSTPTTAPESSVTSERAGVDRMNSTDRASRPFTSMAISAAPLGRMSCASRRSISACNSAVRGMKSSVSVVAAPSDISVPRLTMRSFQSGSSSATGYGVGLHGAPRAAAGCPRTPHGA